MERIVTELEQRLLQNGSVVFYHSPFIYESHASQLVDAGWELKEIYSAECGSIEEFYDQVSVGLEFPNYFGRNLDALRDCVSDYALPEKECLALSMLRFDILSEENREFAYAVLDIFAEAERTLLMEGKRLLTMVQSDNPKIHFPAVGATPALWNHEEWLDSKRMGSQQGSGGNG